jgi:hypothetical protein
MRSRLPIDETGNTYGRLTVLRRSDKVKPGGRLWVCQCVCGTIKDVHGPDLREGKVRSCGCIKAQNRLRYSRRYFAKNALDKIDDDIL